MSTLLLNSTTVSKKLDELQDIYPHLRIGVASIAAYIRERGHEVSVLDPQAEKMQMDQTVEAIVRQRPKYLGMPAYTEEIYDAAEIARRVKEELPDVITILGGPHVSAMKEQTLEEFASFDIGVLGEGEKTFLELVEGRSPEKVNGVVYRSPSGAAVSSPARELMDMDELPIPAWDLYDLEKYSKLLPVELIRGCPYACTFCYRALTRKARRKKTEKVIDELKFYVENYGVNKFGFATNGIFPLGKEHGIEISEAIIQSQLNIQFLTATRVNIAVDEELMRAMGKAGCELINLGIESGDVEVLKNCGKGTKIGDAEKALRILHRCGIKTSLNFILGLPGENKRSLENTRRFAMRNRKYAVGVNFAILVPYPGTKTFYMATHSLNGLKMGTENWAAFGKQGGNAIVLDNFAPGELKRYQLRLYIEYCLRSPRAFLKNINWARVCYVLKRIFLPSSIGTRELNTEMERARAVV
jgi:anaerobic magnesium-protoporphyrin IX monomethyl ester cyclase